MKGWDEAGDGEAYEYGKGQLTEIRGMEKSLEDGGVCYPGAADDVQAAETGQLSKGGVEHGGVGVLGHLWGVSTVGDGRMEYRRIG